MLNRDKAPRGSTLDTTPGWYPGHRPPAILEAMTDSSSAELLVGLAIVVYLCSRQLTWRPVDPPRMLRIPILLGAFGVFSITQSSKVSSITRADVVILAVSAALSIASGLVMGRIARFRPIRADPNPRGSAAPTTESRTGWLGVGLWLALVTLRLLLDVLGRRSGAEVATSAGVFLVVIALNRAARALVFAGRLVRHQATPASR